MRVGAGPAQNTRNATAAELTAEARFLQDLRRIGVLGGLAVVLILGYMTIRVWDEGWKVDSRPADAIVIMGAAQYDGRPSPLFMARLDHALALFEAGRAPRLIVTGGKAAGDRTTEAAAAREYLVRHGVDDAVILAEDQSRTTETSIWAVAGLMRELRLSSALIVSDRPHMLRVLRMAGDAGIDGRGSPTPSSPLERDMLVRIDALAHEVGGLAAYFVLGAGN
ncbi:MAG: YdcF family protein [Chloroflexi bacterium]|nr:YdcF family protein [Chloroflexota bacterium]